jgi:hypothetical protein
MHFTVTNWGGSCDNEWHRPARKSAGTPVPYPAQYGAQVVVF